MAIAVATLHGHRVALSDADLDRFTQSVRGAVLSPDDAADVRPVFNAMYPSNPGLIVRPLDAQDVSAAVRFARERELRIAVRGGGHSIAGLSAGGGGLLIDLSPINQVRVEREQGLVRVGGGAVWGEVDRATQAFGLATPGGNVSDTGVAGLALGGGYGHLRRKFGLTCDNLEEAHVVTVDGSVQIASERENADLLWGLRGGGGNFGVVTSFAFRVHAVGPEIANVTAFHAVEDTAELLAAWRAFTEVASDEVSSSVSVITLPDSPLLPGRLRGRALAIASGVYAGDPEAGLRALEPLRALGNPVTSSAQRIEYTALQSGFDPLLPRSHFQAYWKSQYLDALSDSVIAVIADAAPDRPYPMTSITVLQMGGAIAAVAPHETAFHERRSPYLLTIDGLWTDPGDNDPNIAWVRATWDAVARFGTGRAYPNFLGHSLTGDEPELESALAGNRQRLAAIKAVYDPGNLFRLNDNISPEPAGRVLTFGEFP